MSQPDLFARHLGRAVKALTIGDALADPIRPSQRDVGVDAALAVYAQGLLWALTIDADQAAPTSLEQAWTTAAPDLLAAAADEAAIRSARAALARSPLRRAEMTDAEQEGDLGAVRTVLRGLIRALRQRQPSRARLSVRRWVRGGLVAVVAIAAVSVLALVATRLLRGRDLAAGKPWIASSIEQGCEVNTGICQGQAVDLLVHTRQEESPWVRVDLTSPQRVSSILEESSRACQRLLQKLL